MAVGRLAPSPTGFLHLGNAWAFYMAWLDIRSRGGRLLLRLEDIDPDRSKAAFAEALKRDLGWLGLDWDGETTPQSERLGEYNRVLEGFGRRGLTYPCYCTRKELRSLAGAPQVGDAGAPYPGTCRDLTEAQRAKLEAEGRRHALRLRCPADQVWEFRDRVQGRVAMTLAECGGDFALQRSDGVVAYQLAVVVDDMAAGVDSVVRGGDILMSTPRQLYLYSLLGAQPPAYAHLPLVFDHEGERLAKRHSSMSLETLREAGVKPGTILGAFLWWGGLAEGFAPAKAADIPAGFALEKLSPRPITLPPRPVEYLLGLQG